MKTHISAAAFAAFVIYLFSTVSALATEAKATAWVNVRSGPGSGYSVVDTMAKNEVGNITECRSNGWCYVQRSGPDGWVSSSYLTALTAPSDPNCRVRLVIGSGGPRFVVSCDGGSSGVDVEVGTPAPNRVCFFANNNYSGASFCRQPGLYNAMPGGFNNKISSIRLHGNAKVRVCEFRNMGPFCRDLSSSDPSIGSMLNDRISSFRVHRGGLPPLKQACLFDGNNFTGQHACFRVGVHRLPAAAFNKASSVRLHAGARVRLSQNPTYGVGGAYHITTSKPSLPAAWNNKTKSVKVE
ncbi:SH3 domain-containing protein [Alisedimentitalea sp. MJ-SS2]|uniref:SH3 domain-containing protein n=1 Tax=Aliisedimentitalea sp. MJ-SS2 TaxID=3049795 RepID=UPI0029067126|nr:SH3 domain-containing protein [Alisedimentitalea sp. MJ-SS2]MDU8928232.1 SH3 domain-containing protein [Alisedimentitalea sp. MJ-SS2]